MEKRNDAGGRLRSTWTRIREYELTGLPARIFNLAVTGFLVYEVVRQSARLIGSGNGLLAVMAMAAALAAFITAWRRSGEEDGDE